MSKETYQLPDLGYEYDALDPAYSAELLELHYTKHHQTYVDGANKAREELAEARKKKDFDKLDQLQKNLAFNLSGHILHSIFWRNMSPGEDHSPPDELKREIDACFGSLEALRGEIESAGTGIQGSGWAALSWEPISESLIVQQVYDHQGNIGNGTVPVLVMDMWEHAYYLQYRNEKERWAKAFWDLINWRDVSERLDGVRNMDLRARPGSANERASSEKLRAMR